MASGDVSVPVDEDDAELEEARNPTSPQLLWALIFQQLKNSVLNEVPSLEAVAGRVLGRYKGVRTDPRLRRFLEGNRAQCVPAFPRWCRDAGTMAALGLWGLLGWYRLVLWLMMGCGLGFGCVVGLES